MWNSTKLYFKALVDLKECDPYELGAKKSEINIFTQCINNLFLKFKFVIANI